MAAYEGLNDSIIFDFETISTDRINGCVISMAMLSFSMNRFESMPYTYKELLDNTKFIKFDVQDQVKNYKRSVDKETVDWWAKQPKEAQKQLAPSKEDKSISELFSFWTLNKPTNLKRVFSRGNAFDPIVLDYILKQTGIPPDSAYNFWEIRDTRSFIEGLTYGSNIDNRFIPTGLDKYFVAHNPRHDIVMDVMRMQHLIRLLFVEEDDIPF